jgi:hypothetical protein
MSNTSLNYFEARGTAAERALFTPPAVVPAAGPGMGITWFETDTGDLYSWDGATWVQVGGTLGNHAASHEAGGGDEINVAGLLGVLADPQTVAVDPAGALDGDGSAGSPLAVSEAGKTRAIVYVIEEGTVLTSGIAGELSIPFACTITGIRLMADQAGSVVIDIWKASFLNYPPLVANSIFSSGKPTITADSKIDDTTLTGVDTAIAAGDTLVFNVDSATTIRRVTITITVTI